MKQSRVGLSALMLLLSIGIAAMAEASDAAIQAALRSDARTPEERARDVYRHPGATLEFMGIAPDMTIVELMPGGGWYTHIVGPLVREKGRYIGVETDPEIYPDYPDYAARLAKYPARVEANRAMLGEGARGTWLLEGEIAQDDSVDLVLGVRFMHNWIARDYADKALTKLHRALKPDGTFAIVQHRAGEDDSRDTLTLAKAGYVKQSVVVELMQKHGFVLSKQSEINANPKDTRDYSEGVWTLPPSFALGDQDKAKYQAIGESDRMTLEFTKSK
jgi:predicted methyltransferase